MPTGQYARPSAEERFWSKVDRSGGPDACWPFIGTISNYGYGLIRVRDKMMLAHRFSWELEFGPIPDGLFSCHHCDNRPCVNTTHLFLGTFADNMADMMQKGRQQRGHLPHTTKLTREHVETIRRRYADGGVTMAVLGSEYGVSHVQIHMIVRGLSWRDVH